MNKSEMHKHYHVVEQAINFISHYVDKQPTLTEVAKAVGMSEYHLQRVFSEWAGISPKRFLQLMTKQTALEALKGTESIIEASEKIGLSGASRLHDLMVSCEGMTPGEVKSAGEGVLISYSTITTPFGEAVLAWTQRGICYLQFIVQKEEQLIEALFAQWPMARFVVNDKEGAILGKKIFSSPLKRGRIHLVLKGTNFQVKVWEALINTHASQKLSYSQLSRLAGSPKASRAVGTALANNTIGYLIPCHRVIKNSGYIGNYRWGKERKVAMLAWEDSLNNT